MTASSARRGALLSIGGVERRTKCALIAAVPLMLAGCQQILGIDGTVARDAGKRSSTRSALDAGHHEKQNDLDAQVAELGKPSSLGPADGSNAKLPDASSMDAARDSGMTDHDARAEGGLTGDDDSGPSDAGSPAPDAPTPPATDDYLVPIIGGVVL